MNIFFLDFQYMLYGTKTHPPAYLKPDSSTAFISGFVMISGSIHFKLVKVFKNGIVGYVIYSLPFAFYVTRSSQNLLTGTCSFLILSLLATPFIPLSYFISAAPFLLLSFNNTYDSQSYYYVKIDL